MRNMGGPTQLLLDTAFTAFHRFFCPRHSVHPDTSMCRVLSVMPRPVAKSRYTVAAYFYTRRETNSVQTRALTVVTSKNLTSGSDATSGVTSAFSTPPNMTTSPLAKSVVPWYSMDSPSPQAAMSRVGEESACYCCCLQGNRTSERLQNEDVFGKAHNTVKKKETLYTVLPCWT